MMDTMVKSTGVFSFILLVIYRILYEYALFYLNKKRYQNISFENTYINNKNDLSNC